MRQPRAQAVAKRGTETRPPRRRAERGSRQPSSLLRPDDQRPDWEPSDDAEFDIESVVIDIEEARTPKSDLAKEIAASAKGNRAIDAIKNRRGAGVIHEINPYDLYLKAGWNYRNFDTPKRRRRVASLGTSIANSGVREVLIAHLDGDKIMIHSGWTRLLGVYYAIEVLGHEVRTVPVRFEKHPSNDADWVFSQIVNNDQDPLTPYETGRIYKQLVQMGWEVSDIAKRSGKSPTNVRVLLDLQALPSAIQQLVDAGTFSAFNATTAYKSCGQDSEKTMEQLNLMMANARAENAKRVMPKHALTREERKAARLKSGRRSAGRPRKGDPLALPQPNPNPIPRILQVLRAARYEKDEEAGVVMMWFGVSDFNDLMVLAELPEPEETVEQTEAPTVASEVDDVNEGDETPQTEPVVEPEPQVAEDDLSEVA